MPQPPHALNPEWFFRDLSRHSCQVHSRKMVCIFNLEGKPGIVPDLVVC